jgi:hypothetical protein
MSYTIRQTRAQSDVDGSGSASGTISGVSQEVAASKFVVDSVFPVVADFLLAAAFTAAGVQAVSMVADQDCTLEANSGGSPTFTISLKAGRALQWAAHDGYFTNPITGNITTGFYLTTTSPTRLKIGVGYN